MKRALLLPLVLAVIVVVGASGCGVTVHGSAQAPVSVTEPPELGPFPTKTGSSVPQTSSEVPRPPGPLAGVDPCSLVTAAEVAELKSGPGVAERIGSARMCTYKRPYSGGDGFVIGVAIFDELSLDEVVAHDTPKPVTVGKRRAVQSIGGFFTCAVTMEVSPTSRVDTQGTTGRKDERACELALQLARMVEPKLPA